MTERQGSHPTSDECLHDLQQASPCHGAPTPSQPGQPHRQQDSRRVVVCPGAQAETVVLRSGFQGQREREREGRERENPLNHCESIFYFEDDSFRHWPTGTLSMHI